MPEPLFPLPEETLEETPRPSPLHGNQGDRGPAAPRPEFPAALAIALSREAGARGTTIARRVGAKLNWQVFSQELIEYISQEGNFRQEIVNQLSAGALQWVETYLDRLQQEHHLEDHPSILEMTRMILSLGVQGEVILLGIVRSEADKHKAITIAQTISGVKKVISYLLVG